jgi:hypothetical protein
MGQPELDAKLVRYEQDAEKRFDQYNDLINYLLNYASKMDAEGQKTLFELRCILSHKVHEYIASQMQILEYLQKQ